MDEQSTLDHDKHHHQEGEQEGWQPMSPVSGRRHFRQFCHCNCTCIHKCHHQQGQCAHDPGRLLSPRLAGNRRASGGFGCSLPSESLASVVEELATGRMSLAASQEVIYTMPPRKRQMSDFAIERDLGEGAYAFVKQGRYRMGDPDGPPMAIKMVIKSKLLPECILHDFDTGLSLPVELYALRHLREHPHPNIVSMIDAFEDSMYYYIMMPIHGRGEDLFEIIEHSPDFLSPSRVARIFSQIVMAVAHLHNTLGLVHRDIKDENIIIDEEDRIQLIDFGSCGYYRRGAPHVQPDVPLTEADVRCGQRRDQFAAFPGTPDFAPPEIIRGETYDGPAQDIWALGVLLYTLAFKEVPFRTTTDILEHRLKLPFEPSPEIVAMITWCLERDPEARPTATQLQADPWVRENYPSSLLL